MVPRHVPGVTALPSQSGVTGGGHTGTTAVDALEPNTINVGYARKIAG